MAFPGGGFGAGGMGAGQNAGMSDQEQQMVKWVWRTQSLASDHIAETRSVTRSYG